MTTRVRAQRARRKARPPRWRVRLLDAAIIVATGLVCLFVFSFSTRLSYSDPDKHEPPVIVHVQVLNGCGRPGLAGRVAEHMSTMSVGRMRFDVVDVGNYDRTSIRKTFAINRSLEPEAVQDILGAMAIGETEIQDGSTQANDLGIDLTIVLGSAALEPPQPVEHPVQPDEG
jgi:hypothetical protein